MGRTKMGRLFPHRNTSRDYLAAFLQKVAGDIPQGAKVLDAGAGHCPYRSQFDHTAYETADFCQVDKRYGQIDHVCDLREIPVSDARFDVVLCTQVLEHLPEPEAVLRELGRVLRPSGKLVLSAPLYYEEHEAPYDFFRYTQYGLTHLLAKAGFAVESMEWLEGYYGALAHQLRKASLNLPRSPRHYGGGLVGLSAAAAALPQRVGFSLLSRWFAALDRRHKYTAAGHCINYLVIARRLPALQSKAA